MLTIEVASINGLPPPVPMSARLDAQGGSIGRDPGCTLVLPDPEKRISRRHALIEYRGGRFFVRNQGSAIAVLLNGATLDYGAEAPLAEGDRIDIGEFSLRVCATAPAPAPAPVPLPALARPAPRRDDILADFAPPARTNDPFADLIPPSPPEARPMPLPPSAEPAPRKVVARPAPASDPFADLIPAPPPARPVPSPIPAPRSVATQSPAPAIPEDFDPFGEPLQPPPPPASIPATGGREDFRDLVPERHERVDELFGLRGGDPFPPGHPLAAQSAAATPGPAGIDDLLMPGAPTAAAPGRVTPVQRDDAPELNAPIRLPEARPPDRLEQPHAAPQATPAPVPDAAAGASAAEQGPSTTGGMMLSWDERGENGVFDGTRTMVIGGTADRRRGERRRAQAPAQAQTEATVLAPAATAVAAEPVLLRALLDGLGMERWPDGSDLDAETMRRLGRLLRAAVQGTIDLLRARALIKSEVQAHMTMIVTRDNNPLKFSPNAEAALAHLLGPAQRGFMSATAAMDDAYRDLVAHQFGFTAGTRAALADVLHRFDPGELEGRLASKSMLDSLLPAHRKARLWDLFTERFAQISAEAEDDFQRMFGKEFLRAYEAQVAKMSSPERKQDS